MVLLDKSKEKVLLVKRKSGKKEYILGHPFTIPSKWGLPGGTQEPRETPIETGKREVKEETGYDIEISSLIKYIIKAPGHQKITLYGWVVGGQMKPFEEEIEECKWFSVNSLPKRKEMYISHFKSLREILTFKGIYI